MFIDTNFTPIGASARSGAIVPLADVKGNAPSVYKYTSQDSLAAIITAGYFNGIFGILKIWDWIYIDANVDGSLDHAIYFVGRDGTELSGANAAVEVVGGTGYAVGDIVKVTYVDGAVIRNTLLRVTSVNAGVVDGLEIADPGEFSVNPTTLTPLVTAKQSGSGNDGLTVTITLETVFGDIWLAPKAMIAA